MDTKRIFQIARTLPTVGGPGLKLSKNSNMSISKGKKAQILQELAVAAWTCGVLA